jgi:hypothetical protein
MPKIIYRDSYWVAILLDGHIAEKKALLKSRVTPESKGEFG